MLRAYYIWTIFSDWPFFCVCETKKNFPKLKSWPCLVHLNILYKCCQILWESPTKCSRKYLFQPAYQPPKGLNYRTMHNNAIDYCSKLKKYEKGIVPLEILKIRSKFYRTLVLFHGTFCFHSSLVISFFFLEFQKTSHPRKIRNLMY